MEIWVVLSIAAAFFQNVRSMLQKHLKASLSTAGATFSRFIFAAPMVLLGLAALVIFGGYSLPEPNWRFAGFAALGSVAQIAATFLLVYLFGLRNFAVGNAFSKTETIQAAAFGMVFIGDQVTFGAIVALIVSLTGVILISATNGFRNGIFNLPALVGITSGTAFGISGVSYRAASLSLESGEFFLRASFTLACVLVFQTVIMGLWLVWREKGQLSKVLKSWRVSAWVGFAGGAASFGWFSAMTLHNAAYVKAVGQIELVFSIITSIIIFREKASMREFIGIILVSFGIILLLVAS